MPYRKPVIADWKGWNDSGPSLLLEPNSFKQITNWLIIKGRLYPFPTLGIFPPLPTTGGAFNALLGARTFQDSLGNFHTLMLSQLQAFYLNSNGSYNPLTYPGGGTFSPSSSSLFSIEVFQNFAFFANGGAPLSYVQGDQGMYVAGDVPGTCLFLGKLAGQLLMINTTEPVANQLGTQNYPRRVRWSGSENPLEWDDAIDETAGFLDIADVEDELTGWATIGTNGYAFRNGGITAFSPTGVAVDPFYTENFSIGTNGIGCYYPYTLAVYGPFCVFVALDDIYYFDGGTPAPIGENAKKSIFNDINNSVGQISAFFLGTLLGGVDYLSYWLCIPQPGGVTSCWIHHFNSKSWVNQQLPSGDVTVIANIAGYAI
jgi:hypothetical protein